MKICPKCSRSFADADEFCPHHGVKLVAAAEGAALATAATAPPPATAVTAPGPTTTPTASPPATGEDRLIGQTLDGRYLIDAKLGEGGMGVVYRARHTVIEKTVAIKVLKPEVARDGSVVQRFLQEAKAASRIGHASIVDVIDFGRLPDGSAYSVMEFIDGVTLARVLRDQGRMPLERALPIVAQIARALGAAHDKGIVHRDLKPENIFLLDRDGRADFVKIVDFGIAKMSPLEGKADVPRLTRAGTVFGTPEYMAPEQAAGRTDTDHRVDVYALGTILYEMVVGHVPHKGESPVATLAMQMLDPIAPPRQVAPEAGLDAEAEAVIMKALAKERDERYGSMQELSSALEAIAGGVPLDFMPASGSMRFARETGPSPYLAAPLDPPARPDGTEKVAALGAPTTPHGAPFPDDARAGAARRGRRGLWGLVAAVALVGGGVAVAVGTRGSASSPAAAPAADAAPLAVVSPDAAPAAEAVVTPAADAAAPVAVAGAGSHAAPRRPATPTSVPGPGPSPPGGPEVPLDVVVRTVPGGGELFVGADEAGTDGTTFRRPTGTVLEIRCEKPGYEPGKVRVVFDGKDPELACRMKKKVKCVKDLKDPFGDCKE